MTPHAMAYSQSSKMDWKTLKWLCHQEQNGSVSSTEVVRIFSSNTTDILGMISNEVIETNKILVIFMVILINL